MEQVTKRRQLNVNLADAVNRAKTLEFDGRPAGNATIVTDRALASILGCSHQTIYNWRQTGVLENYKMQSPKIIIYKLNDVIEDLERFIK
jgi:hypothetical protein